MSRENVEMISAATEAFNREDLEALAAISDDDMEFVSVFTAVDGGSQTYRGPQGWADYFERLHEAWDSWRVENPRYFDAGDDRLATLVRLVGTGKTSGVEVEREIGIAYTLREGKVWRMRVYLDPAEALEAVGLTP
jgi:ketosteroid isomerase-like protein